MTTDLYLGSSDASRRVRHQRVSGWVTPVGVTGSRVVYQGVFLGRPRVTDLTGRPVAVPRLGRATVTGPHGLIGGTSPGAARTGAVVDLGSGELLWSRRSWIPLSFSPDGELVAAVRQEGGLDASWSLLDAATGELVRDLDLPAGLGASAFAWEDDASLLVAAYGLPGHTFAVLRLDLARDELARVSEIGGRPVGFVAGG